MKLFIQVYKKFCLLTIARLRIKFFTETEHCFTGPGSVDYKRPNRASIKTTYNIREGVWETGISLTSDVCSDVDRGPVHQPLLDVLNNDIGRERDKDVGSSDSQSAVVATFGATYLKHLSSHPPVGHEVGVSLTMLTQYLAP
jgi:hypothetical protein